MSKYQKYFQTMLEENKTLFSHFKELHDKYSLNPEAYQDEFNSEGGKVVEIIRSYEKILCEHSEGGQYSKFSPKLADKFWDAVRGYFPKIDFVGVTY